MSHLTRTRDFKLGELQFGLIKKKIPLNDNFQIDKRVNGVSLINRIKCSWILLSKL